METSPIVQPMPTQIVAPTAVPVSNNVKSAGPSVDPTAFIIRNN
jgi:hypothetical protein